MSDIPLDPTSARQPPDFSGLLTKVWLNGEPLDGAHHLPINDRGAQFGDGLFESMLVVNGQCPLLENHIARLVAGLELLEITVSQAVLIADLMTALEYAAGFYAQRFKLKLRISRGNSNSGYQSERSLKANRLVELTPLQYDFDTLQDGVDLGICDWRLSDQPSLVRVKHLNRLDQVMARRGIDNLSVFDGLMLDQRGYITEATASNIFWLDQQQQLHTPIIDQAGLQGVMRNYLISFAQSIGVTVTESRLRPEQLTEVHAMFISNALMMAVPVNRIKTQQAVIEFSANDWLQTFIKQAIQALKL